MLISLKNFKQVSENHGKVIVKEEVIAKITEDRASAFASLSETKVVAVDSMAKAAVTSSSQTHIVKVSTGNDTAGQVLITVTKVSIPLALHNHKDGQKGTRI